MDKAIIKKINRQITDSRGRSFRTLRISLNDVCNLACTYCVDENKDRSIKEGFVATSKRKKLDENDFVEVVRRISAMTDIDTVRLTGGEPLLFKNISSVIKGLKDIGIANVKLTTNGVFLKGIASELKHAGLDAINVSLDALDEEAFFKITRRKNIEMVLAGIDEATAAGISLKINSVIMKGVNEDQVLPLLEYASEREIAIRYLELMKMGHMHFRHSEFFVPEEEILNHIRTKNVCVSLERTPGSTANYWVTGDMKKFGIIANSSSPFCHDCNRLRLDSYGNIYGCLSNNRGINIMDSLENPFEIEARLRVALSQKQNEFKGSPMSMKSIGG